MKWVYLSRGSASSWFCPPLKTEAPRSERFLSPSLPNLQIRICKSQCNENLHIPLHAYEEPVLKLTGTPLTITSSSVPQNGIGTSPSVRVHCDIDIENFTAMQGREKQEDSQCFFFLCGKWRQGKAECRNMWKLAPTVFSRCSFCMQTASTLSR